MPSAHAKQQLHRFTLDPRGCIVILVLLAAILPPCVHAVATIGGVKLTATKPALNAYTQTYDSRISVTNTRAKAIKGPLAILISGITRRTVVVANSTGKIRKNAYVHIPLPTGVLVPGQTIGTSVVAFTNPTAKNFNFAAKVISKIPGAIPVAPNRMPVADAGADRLVVAGQPVQLNAAASTDPDGDPLSYHWSLVSQPEGSSASLTGSDAVHAALTPDQSGRYQVQLTVHDGQIDSFPETLLLDTTAVRPVAEAGDPIVAVLGEPVALDGSHSLGTTSSLSYDWVLLRKPKKSKAALTDAQTSAPGLVPDKAGDYVARLMVTENTIPSTPDTVTVSTRGVLPVARTGATPSNPAVSQTVTLDGSVSADAAGDALSYRWALLTKPAGSAAQLSDPAAVQPQFTVDQAGVYVAQLVVNDGRYDSDPNAIEINAGNANGGNRNPQITSTPVAAASAGVAYSYDVNATDPDGDTPSFSLTTRPTGMTINSTSGVISWPSPAAGTHPVTVAISDGHGGQATQSFDLVVGTQNAGDPQITTQPVVAGTTGLAYEYDVNATVADGATATFSLVTKPTGMAINSGTGLVTWPTPTVGTHAVSVKLDDGNGGSASQSFDLTVAAPVAATPPANGIVGDFTGRVGFLYGAGGSQGGVAQGAIKPATVGVIRGRATDTADAPLAGVRVSLLDHAELGWTLTRADGGFDLAVNGGSGYAVRFTKAGYLEVQRTLPVIAAHDWTQAPKVVLTALDGAVTAVSAGAATVQIAQGSPVTDEDGSRRATLLFPAGTTAEMVLPDGSAQPLSTLHVRATEFTVGTRRDDAMPGPLPPESAYTYAADYTVDEALAAGADTVRFSKPVAVYTDNFLGFATGTRVPFAYYDRKQASWQGLPDGVVLKLLSVTDGQADLDLDGDGSADTTATLEAWGIDAAEREKLAQLYTPGATFWRARISHFTPGDLNFLKKYPQFFPPDHRRRRRPELNGKDYPCYQKGSLIACESQSVGEAVEIVGTPFALHYNSLWAKTRSAPAMQIPLTGATLPDRLAVVRVELSVAGRRFEFENSTPTPNMVYALDWDGTDVYGQPVSGITRLSGRIRYGYQPEIVSYAVSGGGGAQDVGWGGSRAGGGVSVVGDMSRNLIWMDRPIDDEITPPGHADPHGVGLGNWTLNVHHRFDVNTLAVYEGNGRQRHGADQAVFAVAGNGTNGTNGGPSTGPANEVSFPYPGPIMPSPDGGYYVAPLRHVDGAGIVSMLDCQTEPCPFSTYDTGADGKPLSQVSFSAPDFYDVDTLGRLYFMSFNAIWRVDADQTVRLLGGVPGQRVEGNLPADGTAAKGTPMAPFNVAAGPDGSVYFLQYHDAPSSNLGDLGLNQVYKITPDGRLIHVAGTGVPGTDFSGAEGDARLATFGSITSLRVDSAGFLFITDFTGSRVLRVDPDGVIHLFAGTGQRSCIGKPVLDGVDPLTLCVAPGPLQIGPDQTPYIGLQSNSGRAIVRLGEKTTLIAGGAAGAGIPNGSPLRGATSIGGDFGWDGAGHMLIGDSIQHRIYQVTMAQPTGEVWHIPSRSGDEVYLFDASGRHLQTRHRLTDAPVYGFGYDSAGRLATITDGAGNVTTIEHDVNGNPTGIVAPGGQRTVLNVDAQGQLTRIENPKGEAHVFSWHGAATGYPADSGLLASFKLPGGGTTAFEYDPYGRLLKETNALGGVISLARTELGDGFEIAITSPTGLVTTRRVVENDQGDVVRTNTSPSGAVGSVVYHPNFSNTVTLADGTVVDSVLGPDPQFGMLAPYVQNLSIKKGGITGTMAVTHGLSLDAAGGHLGFGKLTSTQNINSRTYTAEFDGVARQVRRKTPLGRQRSADFDSGGRLLHYTIPGITPLELTWGERGLLSAASQGSSGWTYSYDNRNRITQVADAGGHSQQYSFDLADRPTVATFAAGEEVALGYDADGHTASFAPSGGGTHSIVSDALGNRTAYTPPGQASGYQRQYLLDGSIDKLTLPGGRVQQYSYDSGGRIDAITYPEATVAFSYGSATDVPATLSRTPVSGNTHTLGFTSNTGLITAVAASGASAGTYSYGYDKNFQLTQMNLQSSPQTVNHAISRNNDNQVTAWGPLSFTRGGPDGRVSAITSGNAQLGFGYTAEGRLASRSLTVAADPKYQSTLTWDSAGLLTGRNETVAGETHAFGYGYDSRGRLVSVQQDGGETEHYAWDVDGNRISSALNGNAAVTATFDAQDRILSRGGIAYTVDDDGFLNQIGGDSFVYSSTGELLQATVGGTAVSYDYDGLRRRVRRTEGTAVTQYFYGNPGDPFRMTAYRAADGSLTTLLYDELGMLAALQRSGQLYFVAVDPVGSPRVVTDATGAIIRTAEYDAFGRPGAVTGSFELAVGFAGGLADPVTGLVRFGLRDYDPVTGRWTARDPIFLSGKQFNLYQYVAGNPVSLRDPSGLFCVGASGFSVVGGGGKLCLNKDGFSACGELGVGVGGSTDLNPWGGLDNTFQGLNVAATAKAGPLASLSAEADIGNYGDPYEGGSQLCTRANFQLKGSIGPIEMSSANLGDPKFDFNTYGELKDAYEAGSLDAKAALEAKATYKVCGQRGWGNLF